VTAPARPVRMVLAKAGLDAHERGIHVLAHGLRDAGFEVIYLGLRQSPEAITATAVQEDADIIGLSSLAGGHVAFTRRVLDLLRDVDDPPLVVLGGLIPEEDRPGLLDAGVQTIVSVESSISDIAEELSAAAHRRREQHHE
jgi:methylmalonyl-CoA mutase C-terminal domain/subunit